MESLLPLSVDGLEAVRTRRAELRESMSALEQALADGTLGGVDTWAQRVHVALVELSADLRSHIDLTEGPGGLHEDVLSTAPHLAGRVRRLTREHGDMTRLVDDVIARALGPMGDDAVADVRSHAATLLGLLVHHRRAGADLLYEAYQADVGGED